jgi:peptidoglycan/LPS O-acetylase OafA/YrhL
MNYIKQLDALRAIAIFFVLCNHWLLEGNIFNKISKIVSAPDIFFTISGFLITLILLKERKKTESQGINRTEVYFVFFFKRSLRILPAYYLTILLTFLFKPDLVPSYSSYLNFTANFEIFNNQEWGPLAHLWSMSVEQQFYIIWPLLIIFLPKRWLLPTIGLFIVIGIASQHIITDKEFGGVLPQTCFDALGIGALLAWVITFKNHLFNTFYQVLRILAIISVVVIISQIIWGNFLVIINHRTLVAVIVTWLMAGFILEGNGGKSYWGLIFKNRALLLIGKMSYGIYLYHSTLFLQLFEIIKWFNGLLPIPHVIQVNQYLFFLENFFILFCIAWLSWRFYELPISKLKRLFEKRKVSRPIAQAA